MSTTCFIEFMYNNKLFSFPQPELGDVFVEDEEFYRAKGNVFSCFRAVFPINDKKLYTVACNYNFDAQLIHQLAELTIEHDNINKAAQKVKDLLNLFKKERLHNHPTNLFFTLTSKSGNICCTHETLIQKISMSKFDNCSTFNLISLVRTSNNNGLHAFNGDSFINQTTFPAKTLKVDRIALTKLAKIESSFGSIKKWSETVVAIIKEASIRISESTGAEKVSTTSPTPKASSKETVE